MQTDMPFGIVDKCRENKVCLKSVKISAIARKISPLILLSDYIGSRDSYEKLAHFIVLLGKYRITPISLPIHSKLHYNCLRCMKRKMNLQGTLLTQCQAIHHINGQI